MKIFSLVTCLTLLLNSYFVNAQAFKVPSVVSYKSDADFKLYEPQIIPAIEWLESTPFDVNIELRQQTSTFLTKWVQGAPNISILVMPYILDLAKDKPQIMSLFLGGWARYALQHPKEKSEYILNMAAVQTVLNAYSRGGLNDQKLNDLQEVQKKGDLGEWVSKRLAR